MRQRHLVVAACAAALGLLRPALADEGMWTFDNVPRALIAERYGARIDDAWLERVRLATARLSNCTASFVSPNGLLLTNHHCAAACLAENSSREASLLDSGFAAARGEDELRCSVQIADVLVDMDDVTAEVTEATRGLDDRAANERRRATLIELEQNCEQASQSSSNPLKCQALTLYDGGQYWLYKYRRYDDVRLVFAPEASMAAFGGDPDNFQFPRWCLDFSVMRAYENGRAASTPNYFKIDFAGPDPGELVFVSGHPGATDRALTVAELKTLRDRDLPQQLLRAAELRGRYIQFAKTGVAEARIVQDPLNGLENTIKVRRKQLDALLDDSLLVTKHDAEAELALRARRARAIPTGSNPWVRIEAAQAVEATRWQPYVFIEAGAGFNSRLFRFARQIVRGADERAKPNAERLPEFADAALPCIEQGLGAPLPIYPELERLTLSFSLERMREWLGPDDATVRELLGTQTPDAVAAALIDGSGLADPQKRLALWRGGKAAVAESDDPLVVLARDLDPKARELRKWHEDEVEAVVEAAHEEIARARFAVYGTSVYPDATFTLRLNFGTVQGWRENGVDVPPMTHLARLFERATGQPPFAIAPSWQAVRAELDPMTPFNLSTNNDIVGGNSGSPLISAEGRVVGLIFDGNIHSISGSYWFDAAKNRAVAVHPAIIKEALTKVYKATELSRELGIAD